MRMSSITPDAATSLHRRIRDMLPHRHPAFNPIPEQPISTLQSTLCTLSAGNQTKLCVSDYHLGNQKVTLSIERASSVLFQFIPSDRMFDPVKIFQSTEEFASKNNDLGWLIARQRVALEHQSSFSVDIADILSHKALTLKERLLVVQLVANQLGVEFFYIKKGRVDAYGIDEDEGCITETHEKTPFIVYFSNRSNSWLFFDPVYQEVHELVSICTDRKDKFQVFFFHFANEDSEYVYSAVRPFDHVEGYY